MVYTGIMKYDDGLLIFVFLTFDLNNLHKDNKMDTKTEINQQDFDFYQNQSENLYKLLAKTKRKRNAMYFNIAAWFFALGFILGGFV